MDATAAADRLAIAIEAAGPVPCGQNPDAWFPDSGQNVGAIIRLCEICPVQRECLDYALIANESYGVWGGQSERSRRALRARLDRARRAA